jgi:cephalosporin hydroxylase
MKSDARIIGIDINDTPLAVQHPRITWAIGDCLDPAIRDRVTTLCAGRRGMVIEDSDHKYLVTKAILEAYERYVATGCYFVVEDTCVEFLNLPPFPGPLNAVKEFVAGHRDSFVIDRSREKYVMTYNPMGYLLRTAG